MSRALTTVFLAALLLAGCGSSGDDEPQVYAFAPTRACLEEAQGVEVSTADLDFVATTALGGAMRVDFPNNLVVIAFGQDAAEADRIATAYRNFAGETIPIDDVLRQQGNVVMVWNGGPSGEEEALVLGCLQADG